MPELTSNVSSLVVSQLPDFIRGDYDTITSNSSPYANSSTDYKQFIKFVEAYYKFLEQENSPNEVLQNSRNYADVELTADSANVSLVESFFKTFGPDIPRTLTTDKKSFVKHFRDIYKTKGSEVAARLLFRALYNVDIDFLYPAEYILKPSDGIWIKDQIIKVVPVNGANVFEFINTEITGTNSGAKAIVKDVIRNKLTPEYYSYPLNTFDIYLEKIRGTFFRENIVSSKSSNLKARTQYQLAKIDILDGKIGYSINDEVYHSGSKIKISKVNSSGRILSVDILESGLYFVDDTLPYRFNNEYLLSDGIDINLSYFSSIFDVVINSPVTYLPGTVKVTNNVGVFTANTNHGLSLKNTANLFFNGNTNSGINFLSNVITVNKVLDDKRFQFSLHTNDTSINANLIYLNTADLVANLGILRTSKSYYVKNKGQLSDVYKFQGSLPNSPDNSVLYYQPYSYVIQSPITTNEWKKILKDSIHPAGLEVFGDWLLSPDLKVSTNVIANSEVTDFLGLTADNSIVEKFRADSTTYYDSRFSVTINLTADQVIYIFRYL